MSKKKPKVPSITQQDFDSAEAQLRAALRKWYDDATEKPPSSTSSPATAGAWGGMPAIDSKAVVKASGVIRKFLGVDLDPSLIRKGGYSSFDDLLADLLPKLRGSCPTTLPAGGPAATTAESKEVGG